MVALSFTIIVIQVQAVFHGNARDLLPILIAALLAMTGVARSLRARSELARTLRVGAGLWRLILEHTGGQPARVELPGAHPGTRPHLEPGPVPDFAPAGRLAERPDQYGLADREMQTEPPLVQVLAEPVSEHRPEPEPLPVGQDHQAVRHLDIADLGVGLVDVASERARCAVRRHLETLRRVAQLGGQVMKPAIPWPR